MIYKSRTTFSITFGLVIAYSIGCIGFLTPFLKPIFQQLTPFILIVTCIILLIFHKDWGRKEKIILGIIYLSGFLIELIGIQTGLIFGSYQYGDGLGYKLYGTPLIIGLNWVLLSYTTTTISNTILKNRFFQIISATVLMIVYDLILETVAPYMDMWRFENGDVPFQNYAIWFIVAFIFNSLLTLFKIKGDFRMCLTVFILQILFFGVISLFTNILL